MGTIWLLLGLMPLLGAGWLAAKHGFRVEPGPPRWLATAVLAWAWVTVGVEVVGTAGQLNRGGLVGWSVAGLAVAGLIALVRPKVDTEGLAERGPIGLAAGIATALLVWAVLRIGLVAWLLPVKVNSDGPIYHLYMAARWWKAGRIGLVATPFGEVAATYFWANGELWYAWLLTLGGGDSFAKLGHAPFLGLSGLAIAAIARHLQIGAAAARLAAVWFVTISPQFVFAFEPNVDCILVAGYLLAAYFWLRALTELPGPTCFGWLTLGSLAAGLGMGAKPTGLVFFPPLLALMVLVWLGVRRDRGTGRKWIAVGLILLPALAMMGYWPARNAWLTGNPLYPIHIEAFGRVWLAGWFGPGAMRFSKYYVPRGLWQAGVDIMLTVFDPREFPVWLAAVVGVWAWRRPRGAERSESRARADRWVCGFIGLGLVDLAVYWLVIPYRTQQRFSFPAVALFSIALARLFDCAGWVRWLASGLVALHLLTPQPWPIAANDSQIPWDLMPAVPNALPALLDLPLTAATAGELFTRPRYQATMWLGVGVLGSAIIAGLAGRGRGRSRLWVGRAVAVGWLAPFVVLASGPLGAGAGIKFPFFVDYARGWAELEARVGRRGARIAYAGNKIPYYLMGSQLQSDVQYVNIDAHRDWFLHDYHRHAPEVGEPSTWPNPFPAWGRLRPDYDAWLTNLRAARIDLLVVMRVAIEEGVENAADATRFPIERAWAEAHPESFRPIYGVAERDPRLRIYQILAPR